MPPPVHRLRAALEAEFEFEHELGSGGLGVLWLARERSLGRRVVIKTIRDDQLSPATTSRFLREAQLLARIDDSRVVRVYRAGEADGTPYCVMEHLDGPNLAQRLASGPFSRGELRRLSRDLLAGLVVLHAAGIVHRDLKPANILWLPDRAVLIDLGLARATKADDADVTAEGVRVGTPAYQAPEQAGHPDVGPAADQYAAAAVLYEAATGRRWSGAPAPGAADWRGVRRGMRRVLARALEWSPPKRWPDVAAFRLALERSHRLGQLRWVAGAAIVVWLVSRVWCPFCPPPDRSSASADLAIGSFSGCALDDSTSAILRRFVFRHLDWYAGWRIVERESPATWRLSARTDCGADPAALISLQDSTGVVRQRFAVNIGPDLLQAAQGVADSTAARLWPRDLDEFRHLGGPGRHPGEATRHYFLGEEAFSRDDWGNAEDSYTAALKADSSFQLARWRLMLVKQWRRVPFEDEQAALLKEPGDLPPVLLELIRVAAIPDVRERINRYARIAASHPRDSYAALAYANEVFVRGPLVGIPLDSGLVLMREVEEMDPTRNVAPALDHQAWGAIRLGHQDRARRAVDLRDRLPDTGGLGSFFSLAYWERFHQPIAPVLRWWAFRETSEEDLRLIARVHRLALTFDLPDAQGALAELVLSRAHTQALRASAFEGLGLARMAAGRAVEAFSSFDSAAVYLGGQGGSRTMVWCVATAALGFPAVSPDGVASCEAALRETPTDDPRAWENWAMVALAAGARGDRRDLDRWLLRYESLPANEGTRRWRALLAAERSALDAHWRDALEQSEPAVTYDSAGKIGGAFLRSAAHLRRASWWEAAGDLVRAEAELVWWENTDFRGWPMARSQAGEVDAVLSTVGRVRRARLMLGRGDRSACQLVERVAQLWKQADDRDRLRELTVPLLAQCS